MSTSEGFSTIPEAIEAWNTWRGRYIEIDPETFCKANPCNACGLVVKDGDYSPLSVEDMVGTARMLPNGAFTVPWPRLSRHQATLAKKLYPNCGSVEFVFALRARWCALFPSVIEYRASLTELFKSNDHDNKILNEQLRKWNEYLSMHGFATFDENDLRGVNLSGLTLNGPDYSGITLRNIDLSFSECSVAQLNGANLYGASFIGSNGILLNLAHAICASADFSHGFFSKAKFKGTDLAFSRFKESLCYETKFDGAILRNAFFDDAKCMEASFDILVEEHNGSKIRRKTEIEKLSYNEGSDFTGVNTENVDWIKNPDLLNFIINQNKSYMQTEGKSWWNRLLEATELKPGWLGLSIDIKKFFEKRKA